MSFRPDVDKNVGCPRGCRAGSGPEPDASRAAAPEPRSGGRHRRRPSTLDSPLNATAPREVSPDTAVDPLNGLLARVADGEVDAFATLYDRTSAGVYGVALRILRDPGIAQEVTLQAYTQVWANAHLFEPARGSAQAWLTTLAHRFAVDGVRREPGRAARVLGCGNGNRGGDCDCVIDDVLHHVVRLDGDALDDGQRETIALAYYAGMTYQQVSDFLGEAVPTVTSRIRAAATLLGESLGVR